jgi:hypothetical protein
VQFERLSTQRGYAPGHIYRPVGIGATRYNEYEHSKTQFS